MDAVRSLGSGLLGLVFAAGALAAEAPGLASPRSLVERSIGAMRSDPERSRQAAEQALIELARRPDADLQVMAHWLLCDYHAERDRRAAEQHLADGRALLPQVQRSGLRANLLGCEGDLRELSGDSVQAMALYEQAVAAAEQAHDDEALANALYQRGYLRGVRGEYANGLVDLRRANQTFERLELPGQALTALNAIAILYNRMGDHEQARQTYEAALKAQQAAGMRREQAVTLHNLGRALENLGQWDAAQRAFESTLALSRELAYPRGEAYALRGLASVRNARGAPVEALALLDQSNALQQRSADERLRAQVLLQRGMALRALHRPAEALRALNEALEVFRKADSPAELASTHGELAATLADTGDWRAAFEQQARFKAVSDELLHRQLDQRFATLKVEFDSAAKDKENQLLQREKAATELALEQARKAGRLRAVVIALAALLMAGLALQLWRHRRTSLRMQDLAMTDELTGLPNRRHVLGRLNHLLADGTACALLIVDLDHFKAVNDECGHLVGDEILRVVAGVLRDSGREPVELGRLGGEEFVVVLPTAGLDMAMTVAERLRAQVAALDVSRWLSDRRITISLGVTVSVAGEAMSALLRRADEALFEAKRNGRNRAVVRVGTLASAATPIRREN
ncbi:MAG TPA: tetratricopeptide repeat-containing diguanylate cyclase [Albitalea sp.]|nr:tetratricopeptide repeat-containing diguanylate cyclase [Albitalea sp.]